MPEKENEKTGLITSADSPPNEPETWITPAEASLAMDLMNTVIKRAKRGKIPAK